MSKKTILTIFSVIFSLLLAVTYTFGAQSFTVTPTTVSQTAGLSSAGTGTITISNSGSDNINFTITKVNLVKGSDTITLSTDKTSITNLAASTSTTFNYSYTSGRIPGTYAGSVIVTNTQNSAQVSTIPISLVVTAPTTQSLKITGESSTIKINSDLDIKETVNLEFDNDGSVNLTNLQFSSANLDGNDSSDRIRSSDITFDVEGFNLTTGKSKKVEITIDIPNNIEIDSYSGTLSVVTDEGYTFTWTLQVILAGSDVDIEIQQNGAEVNKGLLTISGEAGDTIRNYEFVVDNVGKIDVTNLVFDLDTDLIEESSGKKISSGAVTFTPSKVSLKDGKDDNVEVKINIPTGQDLGNYYANIRVKSASGTIYDKILLKVEVTGDVYIKELTVDDEVTPEESLDLKVTLKNKGLQLQRNVKITATLANIDNSNTNIHKSSSTFILDINSERTEILKFNIPNDATDGSHTLTIKVKYGDQEFTKIKDITVVRPRYKLDIKSNSVNPTIVTCDKKFFSFMKVENLGKYDEDVKVSSEIAGTTIKKTSNTFEVGVDDVIQKNVQLDVSTLKPGNYQLVQKVIYAGSRFNKVTTNVQIAQCTEFGIGVSINNTIPELNETAKIDPTKVNILGTTLDKSTVYLGAGLSSVIVLIIVSLFLL